MDNRYRGFLASCMLEIAPCVYTAPHISKGVRERIWKTLSSWHNDLGVGWILMTWVDSSEPGGQGVLSIGLPIQKIVEIDGMLLINRKTQF